MNTSTIVDKNILDLKVERPDFAVILDESRKKKKFTDVQLQVGDQLFDAHRVILAAYSPVLEAAISDQWSATKICPISEEYVDPSIVEPLLHFLYTGSIQLTPDNVHPVCVAAHFLQIPSLLEPSVIHLCRMVTVENALSLFEFSVACELETLRLPCLRIIAKNHEKLLRDPRILKFSSRIFNDLISGLKEQNRPRTMLKENTFDCIVRWTEVNLSERLNELPGLLKNIPLEELPLKFLTQTVSRHRLVKESISCIQAVSTALEKVRSQRDDNLVVLGPNSTLRPRDSIFCYDTQTKVWRKLPNMLEPRSCFAATVVNRKDIVVCGGTLTGIANSYAESEQIDTVEMFEWASQTWKQLPKMPFASASCSIASLDGIIYVLGKKAWNENHEVVCYSFETQQWQSVKPMNIFRKHAKLIEYDGYLYVFGDGTIERYDPHFDEWTCLDEKSMYRSDLYVRNMTVHENKIYVGGYSSIDQFDPETDQWIQKFAAGHRGSLFSMNGRLLVASDKGWIYKFSFTTKKWTRFIEFDKEDGVLLTGQFY